MDKQKCIKALLDNLYEVYLQEGTIEKYQSHIQWAFKEAINNMRCFFKNDSFSCENEYRVILKIPEELLLEETTGQDGILKKGQFKRENILIPYVDYKFKRDSLKGITLNPYVKEKESVFELGIRELLWQNKIHNVQIYRSAMTAAGARMCQGIFFVLYYLILKIKYLLKVYGKIELRKTINQST